MIFTLDLDKNHLNRDLEKDICTPGFKYSWRMEAKR